MVLFINEEQQPKYPMDTKTLFDSFSEYKTSGNNFSALPSTLVRHTGSLYVMQQEYAAVAPRNKVVDIMGSDDATTCIIIIVRDRNSGATALAHLDNPPGVEKAVEKIIKNLQHLSDACSQGKYDIYLVGGYQDPKGLSEQLFGEIFKTVQKLPQEIHLKLACIGEANTVVKNRTPWPKVYGVAVKIDTGEIFPATFEEKGPDEILRHVKILAGTSDIMNIYDNQSNIIKIGPFSYTPFHGMEYLLKVSDEVVLQHTSTSPDVEPSDYVTNIKKAVQFMIEHPKATDVFQENKSHFFCRDENSGLWVPASS
nr:unnamed protein product [Callosobruchus chinensis]